MTYAPRQRQNLVVRAAGEDVALYNPSTGTLVQLNPTAYAIWQACDGETSADEIADALVALTGRSASDLQQEVESAIEALADQGLLERQ